LLHHARRNVINGVLSMILDRHSIEAHR